MFNIINSSQLLGYFMSISSTKLGIAQSLVILGVIFLIIGAMMTYQNRKESRFYPVEGVMKTSEIKYVDSAGSAGKLGSKSWFLNVIYEYEVDGKIYLDMVETLAAEIRDFENIEIFSSQICTIQNNQFHSHRREPDIKLRNLTAYIL